MNAATKRLLTFGEVASLLGEQGPEAARRVRRRLLNHPNAEHILVRLGNQNPVHRSDGTSRANGARYLVSLSALRLYLPQTRDHASDVANAVREELEGLDDKVQEARAEVRAVAKLAGEKIRRLEAQVEHLTSVVMGGPACST